MLGIHKIEYPLPHYVTSAERGYQKFLKNYDAGVMGGATEGPSLGLKLVVVASLGFAAYAYYSCVQRGACAGFSRESKQRFLLSQRSRAY